MPVYEYTCDDCGKTTEALRKMADADARQPCEACGSTNTHRRHSVFAAGASTGQARTPLPVGGGCACGNPHGPCATG